MLLPKLLLLLPFAVPPQPLAAYTDHKRVLLVFASAESDPRYQQQVDSLAPYIDKLKERDVVLWPVLFHPRKGPQKLEIRDAPHHSQEEQQALREQFHVKPSEFTVILIGKDGGEKLRQHKPITNKEMSATIDAMPMRQQEMRHKK